MGLGTESGILMELTRLNKLVTHQSELIMHLTKQLDAIYQLLAARVPEPVPAGRPTPPWQER